MLSAKKGDVEAAFALLIEQVDCELERVNEEVSKASRAQDYGRVRQAADEAEWLKSFRGKLEDLGREWRTRSSGKRRRAERDQRRRSVRLPRGAKTPEEAYYQPILSALVELGGRGKVREVLGRVEEKMKPLLKPIDYELLPSGRQVRWRNTAGWAGNQLVERGLMKAGSRKGFWEISSEGRTWVATQVHNKTGNDWRSGDGGSENS
jgi:restriction system protein